MNAPATDTSAPAPLYTIGYGGRTLAAFLTTLRAFQIAQLIDVRTAPYSKFQPEFSRDALDRQLDLAGIHYLFLGDCLGGQPADPACLTDGKVDYIKVRARPFFRQGLDRLGRIALDPRRSALMCSEAKPEHCHRSKLIGEALAAAGIPVLHIDESGRLVSQHEVIHRITHGQLDLFGPTPFTSRTRLAPTRKPQEPPPHCPP
jgi:uncharacterized protein (DUF488 family)